jgi:hypothetical protein
MPSFAAFNRASLKDSPALTSDRVKPMPASAPPGRRHPPGYSCSKFRQPTAHGAPAEQHDAQRFANAQADHYRYDHRITERPELNRQTNKNRAEARNGTKSTFSASPSATAATAAVGRPLDDAFAFLWVGISSSR